MIHPVVVLFVAIALIFACTHWIAIEAYLYWHYWWFDILMHFWGGFLIAFGVVSLTTFRRITIKPTYPVVFVIALMAVCTWELFEWNVGLMDPALHWQDALEDMFLGLLGSMLGLALLKSFDI